MSSESFIYCIAMFTEVENKERTGWDRFAPPKIRTAPQSDPPPFAGSRPLPVNERKSLLAVSGSFITDHRSSSYGLIWGHSSCNETFRGLPVT